MRESEDNEQPHESASSAAPRPKAPPISAAPASDTGTNSPAAQPLAAAWPDGTHRPGSGHIPDDLPTLAQGGRRGAALTRFSGTGVAPLPQVERQERRAKAMTIGLVALALVILVVAILINHRTLAQTADTPSGTLGQITATGTQSSTQVTMSGTITPGLGSATPPLGGGQFTPTVHATGQPTGLPLPTTTTSAQLTPTTISQPTATVSGPPTPTAISPPTATPPGPPTPTAVPGPCTSGWSDFITTDGNLIDSNTNTAAVIQIQYDSNGHWCGAARAEHILRIGANDPSQNVVGQFFAYGNWPNSNPTSSTTDVNQQLSGTSQVQYFTYDSPTWTWQYCVEASTVSHNQSNGQTSTADTGVHCI